MASAVAEIDAGSKRVCFESVCNFSERASKAVSNETVAVGSVDEYKEAGF